MHTKFKTLQEILSVFPDEKTCVTFLEQQRWRGVPICPVCSSDALYVTRSRSKQPEMERCNDYRCKVCDKKFSVRCATLFESSKIPLRVWFAALYLITSHQTGISSIQLATDLSITQKTAWYMINRIREAIRERAPTLLEGINEMATEGRTNKKAVSIRVRPIKK